MSTKKKPLTMKQLDRRLKKIEKALPGILRRLGYISIRHIPRR